LTGAEVNIDKDGALDIDDETLAQLDVVGIAVHSHFHLPRAEMTARIVRAMRSPHADILFHPTGRVLQKREPYDVDMDEIIRVARETGTAPSSTLPRPPRPSRRARVQAIGAGCRS
jgi:DNA polymerase (family 10)